MFGELYADPARLEQFMDAMSGILVNASFINRLSYAVDLIEKRSRQRRALKIIRIPCGFDEDSEVARARHFAAHPTG